MDTGVMRERLYAESLRRIHSALTYSMSQLPPFSAERGKLREIRDEIAALHEKARRG